MENEIKLKQVGQNLNLTLPFKEAITIRIQTKEERDKVLADAKKLIESYNKSNSDRIKKQKISSLQKLFLIDEAIKNKKVERKQIKDEVSKQEERKLIAEKKKKAATSKSIKESKSIQKSTPKVEAKTTAKPRRGEYYGR